MAGRGGGGGIGGGGGLRPDRAVNGHVMAHLPQQPLQYLHRVRARVDIHVKDAGLKDARQIADARAAEIVLDEDAFGLRRAQRLHIAHPDRAVAVNIQPQPPQRVDGDPVIGGATGVVGVVD